MPLNQEGMGMKKLILIVSTLALLAIGVLAEAQAQTRNCVTRYVGNTAYTTCY
jgi:hypothetical protein